MTKLQEVPDVQTVAWVRRLARTGNARLIREGAGISAAKVARELGSLARRCFAMGAR